MQNRKTIYIILFFLLLLALVLGVMILSSKKEELKVVFFNVGQGDAILISQGSSQVLIDSGKSGQILLEKLGRYVPFWDRKIEAILMTHPDQDHIGGFADIFKNYEVEMVFKTNTKSGSKTFENLEEYVRLEGSEIIEAKKGINLQFPNGAKMEIIYPNSSVSENSKDTNSSSIVSILNSGQDKFLFTGDLPGEKELDLIGSGFALNSRVLKVSHHGSKYSTTEEFLKKVSSREVVISVGKNSYGHPAEETINRIKSFGAKILRTDEVGDIKYVCKSFQEKCILQN